MSFILEFLKKNAARLSALGVPAPEQLSYAVATPPFTSCNLTFMFYSRQSPAPVLVAKVPRVADTGGCLTREARSLRAIHRLRPDGFESIPRLIACELCEGELLLLRTAVPGSPLRPAELRHQGDAFLTSSIEWLLDLHRRTAVRAWSDRSAYASLVEAPLSRLERPVANVRDAKRLLAQTRDVTSTVLGLDLPLVFEHGDFGGRNLFVMTNGQLGVTDWEFSEPRGLPAVDLFFLLASVAAARRHTRTRQERLAAFRDAFFGPAAWTRPYVLNYAEAMGLPSAALRPLFLLCWSRYVANLTRRKECAGERFVTDESIYRAQHSPHWQFWQCAMEHADSLAFG